jgi:hypothetical protein
VVGFAQGERLTIVFKHGTLGVRPALDGIQMVLGRRGVPRVGFALGDDPPTSLDQLLSRLEATHTKHFWLVGQGWKFVLASGGRNLDFLEITSENKSESTWGEWVAPFVNSYDFVMAWIADCEYEYWQNARDPIEYRAAGKSFAGLPMISNGLRYPLEQEVIDTSRNPGRRILRHGYIEVVGAVMWLGESFWPLSGADRKQVSDAGWLRISSVGPDAIRLKAAEHCFTEAANSSGALQTQLRSLLFPARNVAADSFIRH